MSILRRMKKELQVKRIDAVVRDASEIPALFNSNGIKYNEVNELNWQDAFPYMPKVRFAIAYTDACILLHYKVSEQTVKAVTLEDQGPVWKDSCVEFFSCPGDDGIYYNIESNCAAAVLVAAGPDRNDREPAPAEVLQGIKRYRFQSGNDWELALMIPYSTYFKHDITSLAGRRIGANFYKCGDDLPVPHFVTWNPVNTEKPDYHRPEFFGTLLFEK